MGLRCTDARLPGIGRLGPAGCWVGRSWSGEPWAKTARGHAAGAAPALSVMPFPGADQSCPVLSVFVVDELTTTLVSSVQPRPRVVERQQLETIIAQNRLEILSDPEQRRRLGGLSGIQALVVGSFAVIGDRLRINARLVAIDSGETIAAHAVSVPRTSEITELLRQSSGRGRNRLVDPAPAARAAAPANSPTIPPTRLPLPGEACDEQDGVRVCAQGLRRTGEGYAAHLGDREPRGRPDRRRNGRPLSHPHWR